MTSGAPIMSSQKIGPSSLVSRTRCCTGALGSSDSMLPTTGFFGGCGIGFSLLGDAIIEVSPAYFLTLSFRGDAKHRTRNLEIPGLRYASRNDRARRFRSQCLRHPHPNLF